jgi:hypothetical protein
VTAVTDSFSIALLMCSYPAGFVSDFAAGSSSGEVQLGSRPALAELTFLEEVPINKNCMSAQMAAKQQGPIAIKQQGFSGIQVQ